MEATKSKTMVIRSSDIDRCPKRSYLPAHYQPDGTCNCARREELEHEIGLLEVERRRLHRDHGVVVARLRELRRSL